MKSTVGISLLCAVFAIPALAQTPKVTGVKNEASFSTSLSPGVLAAIFGTDLAPTSGQTTVTLGNKACYVVFVSAKQVNVQLPVNSGAGTFNLVVSHDGLKSVAFRITLTTYSPAILTTNGSGSGPGVFSDGFNKVSTVFPAKISDTVSGYGVGLGATHPAVATGGTSPASPPAMTLTKPTVTVGGVPAAVTFSELSPGQVGVYQVAFVIPEGVVIGTPNDVIWTIGAVSSPPVTIQIYGVPTTTKLTSPGVSTYGHPVTLTAMVTPSTATGSVTFYDGTDVLGTKTLASGTASLTTTLLPSGKHSLRAYYGGNNGDEASESSPLSHAVSPVTANDFAPPAAYAAGSTTSYAGVGDFNGDGKQDLVVINYEGAVNVLLGKGDGTFQPAIITSSGVAGGNDIATGDFNGDGKTDLAVSVPNGYLSVMLGKGDGTFQPAVEYSAGLLPISVEVADFNGDGKADIVVANNVSSGGGFITVLLGKGDGTFQPAVHHAAGILPFFAAVGDFNGDGKADIAVGDISGVNILVGNGDGTFQPFVTWSYPGGGDNASIVVGDFNGDGKLDLAANGINGVGVLLGKGDGTFHPGVLYPAGGGSMVSGDFNGDGNLDLAMVGVYVLLGNGDGTFRAAQRYAVGSGIVSMVTGDFNRDGRADLALASEHPNSLNQNTSVLLGELSGGTAQTITFGPLINVALGVTPFKITATASSGRPVVFTAKPPTVCTVGPNPDTRKGVGGGIAVTTVGGGLCSITANQSGNAQFPDILPAPAVMRSFSVIPPAAQTITFGALTTQNLGTAPFALSATASSKLAVTFTSNNTAVCTVSGIDVTLLKLGTCSITASQPGDSAWEAAVPVTRTFTVSAGPPAIVSLSPSAGAGKSVTFRAAYSDPNGAGDLSALLLQMNTNQSSANACYVYYQPQGNHLYLANNAGAWITPALTPGKAGMASNSQCTLNAAASSVTIAGNNLTLTVALSFNSTFVISRNVYLYAAGLIGENSGWIKEGTWTPNPMASPPAIVSLSPSGGTGTSVKFGAVYSDPNGAGDLNIVLLEMNSTQSSANACYVYYQPQGNHLYLANNAGAWITPALIPGKAGTASNGQCTLNAGSSSVTMAGNGLSLNIALTFSGTFMGSKNVYLYGAGYSGLNSTWVKKGSWTP